MKTEKTKLSCEEQARKLFGNELKIKTPFLKEFRDVAIETAKAFDIMPDDEKQHGCFNTKAIYAFIAKIANGENFISYGTAFILEVTGEWHISNADMEIFFSIYDDCERFYPDLRSSLPFEYIFSNFLKKKREWQTFLRYKEKGLTEEHRILLSKLRWIVDYARSDYASVYANGKGPFGNSDIVGDIIQALNLTDVDYTDPDQSEDGYPDDLKEKCWDIFDELQFALTDILRRDQ